MQSRFERLIHKHDGQMKRRSVPGALLTVAAIVAAALFLLAPSTTQAAPAEEADSATACRGLSSLALTAGASARVEGRSFSSTTVCGFSVELGALPPVGSDLRPAGSEPCTVIATPGAFSRERATVSIAHRGDCNGVDVRWRVYPTPPSGSGALAYSSGTTSAYAYLLGEDAFGIDMIKNLSHATWTHKADSVLTVSSYQELWGTTDPRAQTRSELHAGAKGAFYCEFTLRWINNYAFTSESECSRN